MLRWANIASAVVLLLGALVHVAAGYTGGTDTSEHALGTDDAYISYRYARNLVEGHGLVFNPGERVEGYTNLGFVLLCAFLLLFVESGGLYWAVVVVNLGLLAVLFALFLRHCSQRMGEAAACLAGWLLALCPALWLWSASGMETLLVTVLQLGLWITMEKIGDGGDHPGVAAPAVLLGLLAFVRADGFVWIGVCVAYLALRGDRHLALRVALASSPAPVLLFLGRWLYYGQIWPNTYYAKVALPLAVRWQRGAEQLYDLAMSHGLLPYLLAFVFVLPWPRTTALRFPSFFAGCLVLYWIHVGGDHFEERFLLILFPLGIATFLRLFADLGRRRLALLAALLVLVQTRPLYDDPRFDYEAGRYDCWVTLGELLSDEPHDHLLAVDAAGKIPYFSGLRTIDMLGLTDPHIARAETGGDSGEAGHDKMDPEYVLDRRPDLIAAWISPSFELAGGLDKERYRRAGYRLKWMLNTSKQSREWDVIDVSEATEREIIDLIIRGYRYGVLAR